jgi:hypothetical protein
MSSCIRGKFEQAAEYFVSLGVAANYSVADHCEEIGVDEELTARRVGMDDSPFCVEQADRRAQSVQDIGKIVHGMRARPDLATHDPRPLDVRREQAHTLAHRVVDGPAGPVTQHLQDRGARDRFLERHGCEVYRSLRLHPLSVEAACLEVGLGHDVGHADRLARGEVEMAVEQGIKFDISVAIELAEPSVRAKMLVDLDREPGCIPGQDGRGTSTDEIRNLLQGGAPQRGIGRCIVDLADERREPVCLEDRHRMDDGVCELPRWRGGRARRELREAGRPIAALDGEKMRQRNAGISNIILA